MDTQDFLDSVLPVQGRRCIAAFQQGWFRNFFGGTNEWAAGGLTRIAKSTDAYFGCSSFGSENKRTQDNVAWVRSFWLDIDTQESKPKETYANRKEALTALTGFCQDVGLPQPLLISSGYGIHAYWACIEDMTPDEWQPTADLLKQATKTWGLAADMTRTADSASVLRPVGSFNMKRESHREVKALNTCQPVDHVTFHAKLYAYVRDNGELPTARTRTENLNADLMIQREYKPSSAHLIAKHCAVIHMMRDKRGDIDQPTWYHGMGVLAFTEEGEEVCQEWSSGHPDYDIFETAAKVAQAKKFAPTTCEKLKECQPDLCGACPHFGKIKSPIVLGIEDQAPQYIPDANGEVPELPYKYVPDMPKGYGWGEVEGSTEPVLWKEAFKANPEAEGPHDQWIKEHVAISDVLFYPTTRISEMLNASDKAYKMAITVIHKTNKQIEFVVDNSIVASGGVELIAEMGKREIMTDNNSALQSYLKAWAKKMRDEYHEVKQLNRFGWTDGSFALGDMLISPTGTTKTLLTKSAVRDARAIHSMGDLATWKYAIDKLLNVPQLQAQQFLMLSSFAAPLYHMLERKGGIVVYAGSMGSSYGKSTACEAGLSIWGNMDDLRFSRFTNNALYEIAGTRYNLPVVADELTNVDAAFASELAYSISDGHGKSRLSAESVVKDSAEWSTIFIGNGNNLLSEKIANHRANSEGELVRLWEFIPQHKPDMPLNEFNKLKELLKENYGLAGPIYAEYLVKSYDAVKLRLEHKREEIIEAFHIRTEERKWANLLACILTSLDIARELGFVDFDVNGMRAWIMGELIRSRTNVSQITADPMEQFSRMLTDLQPGTLVTRGRGNLSKGESATIVGEPRGSTPLMARHIYPVDNNTKEVLLISTTAARDWAVKHGVPLQDIFDRLVNERIASTTIRRLNLGQGVAKYAGVSSSISCWEIDSVRLREAAGDEPLAAKLSVVGAAPSVVHIAPAAQDPGVVDDIDDLISS